MANEPPSLAPHVCEMLTQGGKFALNEDEYLKFTLHTTMLCRWADKVPRDISFFFVEWSDFARLPFRCCGRLTN